MASIRVRLIESTSDPLSKFSGNRKYRFLKYIKRRPKTDKRPFDKHEKLIGDISLNEKYEISHKNMTITIDKNAPLRQALKKEYRQHKNHGLPREI